MSLQYEAAMARRDNASQRLTQFIAAARRLKGHWPPSEDGMISLSVIGNLDYWTFRRLNSVDGNPALKAAFNAFGLDLAKPGHQKLLLTLFAQCHFDSNRGRGQPKQWDGEKLCQLLVDFATLKRRHPKHDEEKLCEQLTEVTAETLQRRLRDARKPSTNPFLKKIIEGLPPLDPRGMTAEQRLAHILERISKGPGNR
jgi:hypothetical protein